ncbi:hypothetical protein ACH5RR_032166 [Cinchona calisaya]|uniref:Myb-like domain-containing protein n=1 Tax=Cinchona calisaya TaxID=153742 RepID=A0ABD2YLE7_9GENT
MIPNNSPSMMKHHQEAAATAVAIQQQQHMSYHHHGSGDGGGGSSVSASGGMFQQQRSAAAAMVSYNNNNNNNNDGRASVSGVLDSSNNTTTTTATTTRFQPNLHGISMDWTPEEQAILDEGLKTYASESSLIRYAKIAVLLKNKTVRDVALRCKWMMKRDFSKRRKDDLILTRKSKERKEKVTDPSAMSSHAMMQAAIDGVTGELLHQNSQAFEQISANLATYQIQNNIGLFCQARDNICQIIKRINEPPYIMKHMPSLPVEVNEELANSILPQSTLPMRIAASVKRGGDHQGMS